MRVELCRASVGECRSRSLGVDVGRWAEHVNDWIIDEVPGRQADDGRGGRAAEEDVLSSLVADEVRGDPSLAEVLSDAGEIRDLKDSAGDVVHCEVVVDLLEVGVHVDPNLIHEKPLRCRLVVDVDELPEDVWSSLLVVGPRCAARIIQEGEDFGVEQNAAI